MTECPYGRAGSWEDTCTACFECPHQRVGSWDSVCAKLETEEVPVVVYQNLPETV